MTEKLKYSDRPDTLRIALTRAVEGYFTETGKKKVGGWKIYLKACILVTIWVAVYAIILTIGANTTIWTVSALYVVRGVISALVGFNIMHDLSHGTFSLNKRLNDFFLFVHESLQGASAFLWKIKHVLLHHSFPDSEKDDDLDAGGVMRLGKHEKRRPWHRYQAWYAVPVYGVLYFSWVIFKDPIKFRKRKIKDYNIPEKKFTKQEKRRFWAAKMIFVLVNIIIPCLWIGWVKAVVGFLVLCFVCGIIISVVFQLAHVVETSTYPKADKNNVLDLTWAELQVLETSNFSPKSKVLRELLGGLNFQIEHHLFMEVCHTHYPAISKIVRPVCIENGYKYHSLSLWGALVSHFRQLDYLGKVD